MRTLHALRLSMVFTVFFAMALTLSGCKQGSSVDNIFGSSQEAPRQQVGDSALTFEPKTWDFGNRLVNTDSSEKTFEITNSTDSPIYISAITGGNSNFGILTDTCNRSPMPFNPGAVCSMTSRFAPIEAGRGGSNFTISYGISTIEPDRFSSILAVTGNGVSPLVFTGLTSIAPVHAKSTVLRWPVTPDATSFMIFLVDNSGQLIFQKTALNMGSVEVLDDGIGNDNCVCEAGEVCSTEVSCTQMTGLIPETTYTYRVRAGDVFGNYDTNTSDITVTTAANLPPQLSDIPNQGIIRGNLLSLNLNDLNTSGDTDRDGDALTYYCRYDTIANGIVSDNAADCTTLGNQGGGNATFNTATGQLTWTPPYSLPTGSQFEFKVWATDGFGARDDKFFVFTVQSVVPVIAHSPAGNNNDAQRDLPLTVNFYNSMQGTTDNDIDTYTCYFDTVVDGSVAANTPCTDLPGIATFAGTGVGGNPPTGILNWTPDVNALGPYEIKVTGTNSAGSGSHIFVATVPLPFFTGLSSITPITHKTAVLRWPTTPTASSFMVFRMIAGAMVYQKTALGSGSVELMDDGVGNEDCVCDPGEVCTSDVSCTLLTGLTPATSYTFRVRAANTLGDYETNSIDRTITTNANRAPLLAAINDQTLIRGTNLSLNSNDENTGQDKDIDGDTLTYSCRYDTTVDGSVSDTAPLCTTLVNQGGGNATFSASTGAFSWTALSSLPPGTQYEFRIKATDEFGASDDEYFMVTVVPAAPIIAHSPAGNIPNADQNVPVVIDFYNSNQGTSDTDVASYSCYFDRLVDGAVGTLSDCSTLPGTFTFGATGSPPTGLFSWTPSVAAIGYYELKVTATNISGSHSQIMTINVVPSFVTDNLLAIYDSRYAKDFAPGINSPSVTTWYDIFSNGYNGLLSGFSYILTSGWSGNGTTTFNEGTGTGPYRLAFDGTNNYVDFGTSINSASNLMFETWVRPTNALGAGKVLLNNTDGTGKGFILEQSNRGDGTLALSLGGESYYEAVLADQPVGYWRLGETSSPAVDVMSKNDGAFSGTNSFNQAGALSGDSNGSFKASTTGGVDIPYSAGLVLSNAMTLEVWIKPTGAPAALSMIIQKGSAYGIWAVAGTQDLIVHFANVAALQTNTGALTLNQWNHVVATFDKDAVAPQLKLYVNNVMVKSANRTTAIPSSFNSVGIGSESGSSVYSAGYLDEVAIYNYALSPSRIAEHFSATNRARCQSSMALINNAWHHVAGLFDSSNNALSLYLNGRHVCTRVQAGTSIAGSTAALTLGARSGGAKAWQGSMTEMRLYNGTSLQTEVAGDGVGNDNGICEANETCTSATATSNLATTKARVGEVFPVSGLKVWLRADMLTGTNGVKLGYWPDASGNNNHFMQGTYANRPTYSTTLGALAKASVTFAGSQTLCSSYGHDMLGNKSHTTFVVGSINAVAATGAIISWGGVGGGSLAGIGVLGSPATPAALWGYNNGGYGFKVTNPAPLDDPKIFAHVRDASFGTSYTAAGSYAFTINGTALAIDTSAMASPAAAINVLAGTYCLGSVFGNTNYFKGNISEVLIFGSALSVADRQKVEGYLAWKYGLQSSLPAGHPYKTTPWL